MKFDSVDLKDYDYLGNLKKPTDVREEDLSWLERILYKFSGVQEAVKYFTMRGFIFAFLWYTSIVWCVFFLYCPLIPLIFFNRRWFRKCTDIILACWEMFPAALLELLVGCRIWISGDDIDPSEGSIIIMNHRNRLDWFFLWAAMLHGTKPPAHRCKFVLKSDVKKIPGIGWGLQMAGFLYIHRSWETDKILLQRSLDYFKDLGNKYQILIFPEGTNLCDYSTAKSNAFAKKEGLPEFKYVLHPRTTGFTFLVDRMKHNSQLDAVYDLTIGYPKTLPDSEVDMVHGKIPEEVHFHIKRYDVSSLPRTEADLKQWCSKLWKEKEETLRKFYTSDVKQFSSKSRCEEAWNAIYFVFFGWTALTFFFIYLTFTNWLCFCWVIGWTVSFTIISQFTDGMQQFEISIHNIFSKFNSSFQKRKSLAKKNSCNCTKANGLAKNGTTGRRGQKLD